MSKKNLRPDDREQHTLAAITIFSKYKKVMPFHIQSSYISGKFCQRLSVICPMHISSQLRQFGTRKSLRRLCLFFTALYLNALFTFLRWHSGTRQSLRWLCMFFFTASYLNGFLTFSTQAVCYEVNKAQSFGEAVLPAFLPTAITTMGRRLLMYVYPQVGYFPVDWGCRIHRLQLCRGVRTPQRGS